ncbi:glycosyltransferase, SP_1767 family [Pseudobutyrivibrio sp. UC1225]|uniref:GT-D fold domain-containing glycosyltransferase n=1 Tax=Pseudobutyrivibrio sp. UC1225 TaxID=1798185 RepID=UPI0008E59C59|nr:GT-D fold domain-containing glycosyltransferase [Pseudobutyrivibrio sp. UC1225]SFO07168.1 glycosyltransferase, SP_1767 family [Pseudobutyrivibrio sp. UC1225]
MKKVYIFGRGVGYSYLKKCLVNDIEIKAFIDNYAQEQVDVDGIPIINEQSICGDYDYVIVSIMSFNPIRQELIESGVPAEKIICFFDEKDADNPAYEEVIDSSKWKAELTWKYTQEVVKPTLYNLPYETNADSLLEKKEIPYVMTEEETIQEVLGAKKSLVRYGDGEFEMMLNRLRLRYQNVDEKLAARLKEIINSNDSRILIAIADNYGNLSKYTDVAANGIRQYLAPSVRAAHMEILDVSKKYGNAYVSRPYFIYKDKNPEVIRKKFNLIKKIWQDQDVIIVEGDHTRFGLGNDLLENVKSVERILVPDKDAFNKYDEILATARKYAANHLTIGIVGPTAAVLAYDLAKEGHWALDIGQLDTEYEWFLRGAEERCDVPYKTVSEYVDKKGYEEMPAELWEKYSGEIIARIEA